ncbi:MAG TPA: hypothetical protein DCP49_08430 [Erysipelotrichaceae bacterium]|nr:hypothetical protein [Erysipelotrichaceae bacterium]
MFSTPVTLILGGGGSKGSYEIGAMKALHKLKIEYNAVAGVSIGALCGAILVQQDLEKLEKWIESFSQGHISDNLFLFPDQYDILPASKGSSLSFLETFCRQGPDIHPLRKSYEKIFDYDKFMRSPIDFACLAYNITKQAPQVFHKKDFTRENALDLLFSSAAYFPAFDLKKVNGDWFADGAYASSVPYELADIFLNPQSIIIDIDGFYHKNPFQSDSSRMLIRPLFKLHYFLDFMDIDLVSQIREGYLETLKYLEEAPGYLYTFYKDDWEQIEKTEKFFLARLAGQEPYRILDHYDPIVGSMYGVLLGYRPRPLDNGYAGKYKLGTLLEIMALICGMPVCTQYHFGDFCARMIDRMKHFDQDPNLSIYPLEYKRMEMKSLRDMTVFFHSLLESFDGRIPAMYEIFVKKFPFPYFAAWAWKTMEAAHLC